MSTWRKWLRSCVFIACALALVGLWLRSFWIWDSLEFRYKSPILSMNSMRGSLLFSANSYALNKAPISEMLHTNWQLYFFASHRPPDVPFFDWWDRLGFHGDAVGVPEPQVYGAPKIWAGTFGIPHWLLALPFVFLGGWPMLREFRQIRRRRQGCCETCGAALVVQEPGILCPHCAPLGGSGSGRPGRVWRKWLRPCMLLACALAIVGLWVRSFWVLDHLSFAHGDYHLGSTSIYGSLSVGADIGHEEPDPVLDLPPGWALPNPHDSDFAWEMGYHANHEPSAVLLKGWRKLGFSGRSLEIHSPDGRSWRYMGGIGFPHWLLSLPFFFFGTRSMLREYRITRRRKQGRCLTCGYDVRAHHPGDKCPECGTLIAPGVSKPQAAKA